MYLSTIARQLGRYAPPGRGSLGTIAPCADAGTGLLIDCWRAAEQKGLGYALSQSELSKVATAYQRIMRPNSLAGWVKSGNRMVWKPSGLGSFRRRGGMGDDSLLVDNFDNGDMPGAGGSWVPGAQTPITPPPSYITPPDPFTIAAGQPSKPVDLTKWFPPVLPAPVTPQFLLQAAALPNAPASVKAAVPAAQAALAQQASTFDFGWLTQQMISGIPNYALVGAGLVVLLMLGKRRR